MLRHTELAFPCSLCPSTAQAMVCSLETKQQGKFQVFLSQLLAMVWKGGENSPFPKVSV